MNTTTEPRPAGQLAAALLAAQSAVKSIPHDARNEYHKFNYTSAEAILTECRAVLNAAGLSLLPAGQRVTVADGQLLLSREFVLLHTSGEERALSTAWPIVPDKGRPADKACASAATTSLAYLLRDLLLAPRVDPADDLAGREDRPEPAKRKAAPATNGTPASRPDVTAKLGQAGAVKLTELAERKGVLVAEYIAKVAVAGTPPEDLSTIQARQAWRLLSALPDGTPAVPSVAGNGTSNRRASSVPF